MIYHDETYNVEKRRGCTVTVQPRCAKQSFLSYIIASGLGVSERGRPDTWLSLDVVGEDGHRADLGADVGRYLNGLAVSGGYVVALDDG